MAASARDKVVKIEDPELKEEPDDELAKLLVPADKSDMNERIVAQLQSRENVLSSRFFFSIVLHAYFYKYAK